MSLLPWYLRLLPDPSKYPPLPLSHSLIAFARFLSLFRVFVVILMASMMLLGIGSFGVIYPSLFLGLAVVYMVFSGVIVLMRRQDTLQANEQLAHSLLDITFLSTMAGLSGGTQSGAAILVLLITGLGAGLCSKTGWKILVLWAISATLANEIIRYEGLSGVVYYSNSVYSAISPIRLGGVNWTINVPEIYLPTFFLGLAYVVTGWIANRLGYRLRTIDLEQDKRQARLDLQLRINGVMMTSMEEGIILVDRKAQIHQINRRAQTLLALDANLAVPNLRDISQRLYDHFIQWRKKKDIAECDFRINQSRNLYFARFLSVPPDARMSIIFVQDKEQVRAQAQKLKMGALGLLTANIAHEIRNPLSAIHQSAEFLQDDLSAESVHGASGDTLSEETKKSWQNLARIILEHSERIDRIIADVSELGRRDRVSKIVRPLAGLVDEVLRQFNSGRAQESTSIKDIVALDIPRNINIEFDPNHFHQIVINLLNNAWHFCQKRAGSIRLHAQCDVGSEEVRLYVVDDGPGIAPDIVVNIFEPFFTHRSGGSGLGLYVSKELAEANDGQLIFLDNAPGAYFCLSARGNKTA